VGTFAHEPHALAGVLSVKPGLELAQLVVVELFEERDTRDVFDTATRRTLPLPAPGVEPVTRSSPLSHAGNTFVIRLRRV
jgi:hypothetical protein